MVQSFKYLDKVQVHFMREQDSRQFDCVLVPYIVKCKMLFCHMHP